MRYEDWLLGMFIQFGMDKLFQREDIVRYFHTALGYNHIEMITDEQEEYDKAGWDVVMDNMLGFGSAPIKGEGKPVEYRYRTIHGYMLTPTAFRYLEKKHGRRLS